MISYVTELTASRIAPFLVVKPLILKIGFFVAFLSYPKNPTDLTSIYKQWFLPIGFIGFIITTTYPNTCPVTTANMWYFPFW